jgi:hypothetical protein
MDNQRLGSEAQEMKQKIQELSSIVEALQTLLRDAQVAGLQGEDSAGATGQEMWAPEDEGEVQRRLLYYNEKVSHWANSVCVGSVSELMKSCRGDPADLEKLLSCLQLVSHGVDQETLESLCENDVGDEGADVAKILPSLLLTTLVFHDICTKVFLDPWFFVDYRKRNVEEREHGQTSKTMADMYSMLLRTGEFYQNSCEVVDRQ